MRLSRFFIDDELTLQQTIAPPDAVAHYMRHVLRLKDGAEVLLFNGQRLEDYRSLVHFEGKRLKLTPLESIPKNSESALHTHLLLAIGKPEHIDFALQKTTELGVSRISLFNSERTQTRIKGNRLDKKLAHWRGVIISACEQCGRNLLPEINVYSSLHDCISQDNPAGNRLLLDFDGIPLNQQLKSCDAKLAYDLLVGAEGGLSETEIRIAQSAGFKSIHLGARVLRMETAAATIIGLIQYAFGDMPGPLPKSRK